MLKAVGCHEHGQVIDTFGFTGPQLITLSKLLFEDELSLRHEKRGVMNKFEATLLVCARLRLSLSKVQEMGRLFGRDPAALSAFMKLAVDTILSRFGHLIQLENMTRFANKSAEWNQAFNRKYMDHTGGQPMPGRFANVNCLLDGFRMPVAIPSKANDIFVNPVSASTANIAFLLVTGANGLILGVSDAYPGNDQDAKVAHDSLITTHLQNANLTALCDAIFPHTETIRPLPSQNDNIQCTEAERAAASQLRIAVEWSTAEVQEKFQYFRERTKQKVLQTRPAALFRVAVIIQNCRRCLEDSSANNYFEADCPTIESYLVPE